MSEASKLQLVPPPKNLSPDEVYLWIQGQAEKTSAICNEAKQHWERLQKYHQSIADLMGELVEYNKDPENNKDAIGEIVDVAVQVMQSIIDVQEGRTISQGSVDIYEAEKQIFGENLAEVEREYEDSKAKFLAAYNRHKAKLGLSSRDAVAKLTGINPRYISEIELGKHKPQFKTIKRIAEGFGADVNEFI